MKIVIIGLGIQGHKRLLASSMDTILKVDPVVAACDFKSIYQVPLSEYDAAIVATPDALKFEIIKYLLKKVLPKSKWPSIRVNTFFSFLKYGILIEFGYYLTVDKKSCKKKSSAKQRPVENKSSHNRLCRGIKKTFYLIDTVFCVEWNNCSFKLSTRMNTGFNSSKDLKYGYSYNKGYSQ